VRTRYFPFQWPRAQSDLGLSMTLLVPLVLTLLLMLAFIWAVWTKPRKNLNDTRLTINEFLPIHHREYEDVSNRLARYEELLRQIQSERRETALTYVNALHDDFVRVERLINHATKFLPEVKFSDECERLFRALWFRLEFRWLRLSIRVGFSPVARLGALTREVRNLAEWADKVIAQVARECGLPVLESDLNR